jgi:hypothetical protein
MVESRAKRRSADSVLNHTVSEMLLAEMRVLKETGTGALRVTSGPTCLSPRGQTGAIRYRLGRSARPRFAATGCKFSTYWPDSHCLSRAFLPDRFGTVSGLRLRSSLARHSPPLLSQVLLRYELSRQLSDKRRCPARVAK